MFKMLESASSAIIQTASFWRENPQRSSALDSSNTSLISNANEATEKSTQPPSLSQRLANLGLREKPFCLRDQYDQNNWLHDPVKLDGDDRYIINRATVDRYTDKQTGEIINPFTGDNAVSYEDAKKDIDLFISSFESLNDDIKEFEEYYESLSANIDDIEKLTQEFVLVKTDEEITKKFKIESENELLKTIPRKITHRVRVSIGTVKCYLEKLVTSYNKRGSIDKPGQELLDELTTIRGEIWRHQLLVGLSDSLSLSGSITLSKSVDESDNILTRSNSLSLSGSVTMFKQSFGEPDNTLIEKLKPMSPKLASLNKLARKHLSLPEEDNVNNTPKIK